MTVTGTSSGIGRTTTEYLLKQGDIVVATLRKPEVLAELQRQYPADKLLVLKLDVSKPEDVSNAFVKAKEAFGRIDVVFNNAGYGILAEVEAGDEGVARSMFDTNFWGAITVSKEAVKFFRDINEPSGGRLIVNSSYAAMQSNALFSFYSASKAGECVPLSFGGKHGSVTHSILQRWSPCMKHWLSSLIRNGT